MSKFIFFKNPAISPFKFLKIGKKYESSKKFNNYEKFNSMFQNLIVMFKVFMENAEFIPSWNYSF